MKDLLNDSLAGVIIVLDSAIYTLISSAYKIFMAVASARLLNSDAYSTIANNLYAIIGVVMLFVLAYAIIRSIMDPDQMTKGELSGGKLVQGILTAIIGIAIAPTIFEYLYQAQGLIVEHDVVGKIFFRNFDDAEVAVPNGNTNANDPCQDPNNGTTKANCYVKSLGGAVAATSIWTAFFHPVDGYDAEEIKVKASDFYGAAAGAAVLGLAAVAGTVAVVAATNIWNPVGWLLAGVAIVCGIVAASNVETGDEVNQMSGSGEISLADAYGYSSAGKGFNIYTGFLGKYTDDDQEIEYYWGVSTICGLFALYSFVSFTIDMGVRSAKLAFYQIIAPIPIILQILPKFKSTYQNYIKSLITTFIEVFIRIAVVYIVVYIICHLTDMFSTSATLWENQNLNLGERMFALALLIMGLIIFAQQAPKFISDSLGFSSAMGDFKSLGQKLREGGAFAAAGIAGAGIGGAIHGYKDDGQRYNPRTHQMEDPTVRDRLGRAASGLFNSAIRGGLNVYSGTKGAEAMRAGAKQARDIASDSIADEDEARRKRIENAGKTVQAHQESREAERKIRALEAAANRRRNGEAAEEGDDELLEGLLDGDQIDEKKYEDKMSELQAELKQKRRYRIQNKVMYDISTAWDSIAPRINTEREEKKMKFAKDFQNLNGDLREMAYEDDQSFAAGLKRHYDQISSEKVSEYREGWNEESANREIDRRQQRIDEMSTQQALSARSASLRKKMEGMDTSSEEYRALEREATICEDQERELARINQNRAMNERGRADIERRLSRSGISASERSSLEAQLATFDQNIADLDQQEQTISGSVKMKMKTEVKADVESEIKLSSAEYAVAVKKHQDEVKAAKDAMEAAADAWVYEQSLDPSSKVSTKLSSFTAEHIAYAREAEDVELSTYDGKKKTVGQLLSGLIGKESYRAGQYSGSRAATDSSYLSQNRFEYTDDHGHTATVYFRQGYDRDGNPDGQYKYYSTPGTPGVADDPASVAFSSHEDFFGKAKGIKAHTAASDAGGFGKDSARYTEIEEYGRLAEHKREQEKKDKK